MISVFFREGKDDFVQKEIELDNLDIAAVRRILKLPPDHEMPDVYNITDEAAVYFTEHHMVEFDFETYQYFFQK